MDNGVHRDDNKIQRARGTGPRATVKKTPGLTVGRGPVPRHAWVHERARGTGPRATKKTPPFTVGRGPVPRQRSRARPCKSGSPDPDPFVIRRSQTTEWGNTHRDDRQRGGQAPALR